MMTPPVHRPLQLSPAMAPPRTSSVVWMRGGISTISLTFCHALHSLPSRFRLPLCRLTGASLMSPPLQMTTPLVHHHMALPLLSHAMALPLMTHLVHPHLPLHLSPAMAPSQLRFPLCSTTCANLMSAPLPMMTPSVHRLMPLPLSHAMDPQLISLLVLPTPRLHFPLWSHPCATLMSPPWLMTTLIVPPTMLLSPAFALQRIPPFPPRYCMAPVSSMTPPMSCATPTYRCWALRCFQRLGLFPSS